MLGSNLINLHPISYPTTRETSQPSSPTTLLHFTLPEPEPESQVEVEMEVETFQKK